MAVVIILEVSLQEKTSIATGNSARQALFFFVGKRKIRKVVSTSTASVTLGEETIKEVEYLAYLWSVVDTQGRG